MSEIHPRENKVPDELYQRIVESWSFESDLRDYRKKTGKPLEEARGELALVVYRTFYRSDGTPKDWNKMSNSPTGPKARFLHFIRDFEREAWEERLFQMMAEDNEIFDGE